MIRDALDLLIDILRGFVERIRLPTSSLRVLLRWRPLAIVAILIALLINLDVLPSNPPASAEDSAAVAENPIRRVGFSAATRQSFRDVRTTRTPSAQIVGGLTFPIAADKTYCYTNDWGFFRAQGSGIGSGHLGNDIFAPTGTPVMAMSAGTIRDVGWGGLGGNKLWIDGTNNVNYYYAHMNAYSPIAREGYRVKAGEVVGYVGSTASGGGAGQPHLHVSMSYGRYTANALFNPHPHLIRVDPKKGTGRC